MPGPVTSPVAVAPPRPCCAQPDPSTAQPCVLCAGATCGRCRSIVNGRIICSRCAAQINAELEREQAKPTSIPGAVLGGVAGALVGGGAWALVAVFTGYAIGYLAVGVGFVAGLGVYFGAGKRKGPQLQVIAVACALLGLLLGKYFTLAHFVVKEDPTLGYFNPKVASYFVSHLGKFMRPFDILWIFLALGAAHRVVKPTMTRVRQASGSK